jgi:hypothetical protein
MPHSAWVGGQATPARPPKRPRPLSQERKAKAHSPSTAPPEQPHARLRVHALDAGALSSVERLLSVAADKRRSKATATAGLSGAGGISGSSRATAASRGGASALSASGSTAARLVASVAGRAGGARRPGVG